MGFLKWLVESLGSRNDKVNGDAEDENDVNNSKSVEETHHYVNSNLRRQGFSVSAQVPVDRADQTGPILVPSSPGDGGVQTSDLPLKKQTTPDSSIPSSSSPSYTCFSDQAVREGLWSGTSVGGGHGGVEITQGSVDMREAVQRELEKEKIREEILAEEIAKIREEILAEEIARRCVLEAEVRTELMIEREMMKMQIGGGFPLSTILGPQRSHNALFEPELPRGQPFAPVDGRIASSFDEKYGGSGLHGREIRGFEVDPSQQLPRSSEDAKNKVIDLGKLNGATVSGAKQKPSSSAAAGSSNLSSYVSKNQTEEWSCAVCNFSTTCEHNFNQHLAGKKHQAKITTLKGHKYGAKIGLDVVCEKPVIKMSAKTQPPIIKTSSKCVSISPSATGSTKKPEEWRCAVCAIPAPCERGLKEHLAGTKHQAKVVALRAHNTGADLGYGGAPNKPTTMPAKLLKINKSVKAQPSLIKTSSKRDPTSPPADLEGLWSGRSVGGGEGGEEVFQGSVDKREAIQRELEKERIREEILAEELARKLELEAEVRRELMMERELIKMQIGDGLPSSFMFGPLRSHNNLFEKEMLRDQPVAPMNGTIATSFEEKYGGSGRHGCEIGGFEVDPYHRLPRSLEDAKNKVIDLVKSNGATAPGANQKPPSFPPLSPAAAAGLKEICSDGLKKKTEWKCAICDISTSCENNFYDHLAGKKHQANVANLKAHNTLLKNKLSEKTQPSLIMNSSNCVSIPPALEGLKTKTEKWRCAVCKIYARCEYDFDAHLAGKKHRAKVAALRAQYENLLV